MISSFRDWTWLPRDLLDIIVAKFGQFSQYIHFCGVCSQWRKVALECDTGNKQNLVFLKLCRKKLPMLMIKTKEHNNDMRGLYSVSDGVTYNLQLPLTCSHRLFGSSHGWLMYYHENLVVSLFNPLNKSCISLPSFQLCPNSVCRNPSYYLAKGILSADPIVSPNNFTVAVIYKIVLRKLAVYKSGDMHWKFIDLPEQSNYAFSDIAFHKGYLYGITILGKLVQVDTGSQTVKIIVPAIRRAYAYYLVESQGDLLLVQRVWLFEKEYYKKDDEDFDEESEYFYCTKTVNFMVFKLVNEKDCGEWVQVDKTGEQALFVGGNHCVSVSTVEFPECLSSTIYYTFDLYIKLPPYKCCGPNEDSGFFCLEDKSFHSHHVLDTFERYMEPPIWFVPNPGLA